MGPQYLICTLFLGILFHIPISLTAQEKQLYSGPFQVGNYKGEATYHYTVKDADTIFDGSFQLQSSNLEALLQKEDISFSIKGNFENNYPTGYWTFRFNEFQSDSTSSLEAYQYVVNVNGTQRVASGAFKKGKPDGKWTCAVQHIKNSQIDNITFQSSIEYDNGVPQQSFTVKNERQELVGRFLRNGLAHDEWTLYSDNEVDAVESWRFNEGLLQSILMKTNGDLESTDIYTQYKGETKTIALDNSYLDILKIKLPIDNPSELAKSGIIRLLTENDQYYKTINGILSNLGTTSFSPQFKVRVPYFPLERSELTSLDTIVAITKKSQTISNTLLEDTQLSILKLSDKNVRSIEESLEAVSEEILDPLGEMVRHYKNGILPFIPRNELLLKIWVNGIPDIQKVSKKESIVSDNKSIAKLYSLKKVQTLAKETLQHLDSIQRILTKKISKQKREQEAVALEKKMIAQVEYLERLQDSLQVDSIAPAFYNTIGSIKENAADKLSKYSNIKNAKAKLEYARELVNCFEKLDQVGETIVALPQQQYNIRSEYQDAIWNPFTATIMNESVKKRLIAAYEDVLIPYFLKEIEVGLPCEDTEHWVNMMDATYDRMLVLRNEDTKKLERRLRKVDDPLIVLERLNIKPQNNEK